MFVALMNVVTSTVWGETLDSDKDKELVCIDLKELVTDIAELLSEPNLSDLFPILARFDVQGVESRVEAFKERFDRIFERVIEKRNNHDDAKKKDLLGYMLALEKEGGDGKRPFTMNNVKALLMDVVVGGSHTTISVVEWAMAEMLKDPKILKKAQEEVDRVVGKENIVQESHISQLHFISLVIKETLRLHPVAPILMPRLSSSSCIIDKYLVPAGCSIYVNVWSLHRDPNTWTDPLAFKPERFLQEGGERNFSGTHFDYTPFGAGNRVCAGVGLAERMMRYFLATIVHSFDWNLPEGTELDMSEEFHIVLRKSVPLLAIPTPRLSKNELYL